MNIRRLSILLAMAVMIGSVLACADQSTETAPSTSAPTSTSPGPSASNFYMSTDKDGKNQTTAFSPSQTFYVNLDVNGIEAGTKLQAAWYALDVSGQDPNTPFKTANFTGADLNLAASGPSSIYFDLTPPTNGWPAGHYKVEISIDGTKVGEQTFSVQ